MTAYKIQVAGSAEVVVLHNGYNGYVGLAGQVPAEVTDVIIPWSRAPFARVRSRNLHNELARQWALLRQT